MVSPAAVKQGAQEKQPDELKTGTSLSLILTSPCSPSPIPTPQVTAHLPFLLGPRKSEALSHGPYLKTGSAYLA